MTVAEQVISVFCGVKGHLDDIQQKDISKFEKDFNLLSNRLTEEGNLLMQY